MWENRRFFQVLVGRVGKSKTFPRFPYGRHFHKTYGRGNLLPRRRFRRIGLVDGSFRCGAYGEHADPLPWSGRNRGRRSYVAKRCMVCGKYFVPDPRVRERQKVCKAAACKKTRKRVSQAVWCSKNPGYFKGRYPYVKAWREGRKVSKGESPPRRETVSTRIQDKTPPGKPVYKLTLLFPEGLERTTEPEEVLFTRLTRRTFLATGTGP
jgi:hypothetical protein